jgi:hypothetical protein
MNNTSNSCYISVLNEYQTNIFPSITEKYELAINNNLTLQEVNSWFKKRRDNLLNWLLISPYPSQSIFNEIAQETSLTTKQVRDWFRNQRRKKMKTNSTYSETLRNINLDDAITQLSQLVNAQTFSE